MPTYDYDCAACGGFDALRSLAQRNEPAACPECGAASPRVFAHAPHLACVSPEQRRACEQFLTFLLSEPVQKQALVHGFRPGNPQVPVLFPDSPFTKFTSYGLRNTITATTEIPKAEVVMNLLNSFQRTQAGR